jgi:hypothetical protein
LPTLATFASRKLPFYPTATAATIEIGDSGTRIVWSGNPGEPIFQFFDGGRLTIERIGKLVKVSTVFRDAQGSIVAELVRNQWKVAQPPNTWDRNYTSDALEVKNAQGQIILQIKALPDRVQIQGIWRGRGGSVFALSKNLDGRPGSSMLILPPGHDPRMEPNIPPLFRYPSSTHFGELLNAS